jgi:hypothetical protein
LEVFSLDIYQCSVEKCPMLMTSGVATSTENRKDLEHRSNLHKRNLRSIMQRANIIVGLQDHLAGLKTKL